MCLRGPSPDQKQHELGSPDFGITLYKQTGQQRAQFLRTTSTLSYLPVVYVRLPRFSLLPLVNTFYLTFYFSKTLLFQSSLDFRKRVV